MKRKLLLIASLAVMLVCLFAISVSSECAEHTDSWTLTTGDEGYLGKISAVNICPECDTVLAVETIDPLFETLGYSYSEAGGGITQHYAVNRTAVERYEKLSGETVKFGAVAATRNNVEAEPLDENGKPVSNKVKTVDFTDTQYDVFDIIVNAIPEEHRDATEIICCAYIMAGGKITYIENGAEQVSAVSNTYVGVSEKVDNKEFDTPTVESLKIIDGAKYKILSADDMGLTKWAYWYSTNTTAICDTDNTSSGSTGRKFFATKKFTKEELPVGSIIAVEEGWNYRPEGWIEIDKRNTNTRPVPVYESALVTESWWGNYNYRAFNISPGSAIDDSVTKEDISKVFQIYIPLTSEIATVTPPVSVPEMPFDPTADKEKQDWDADGALKILTIGNSFSEDSMQYVYQVAEAAGATEIVLGNLYIGGCSLDTHLTNATNDSGAYTYYKNTDGAWTKTSNYKISTAVKSEDWDFISFQQVSGYSGISDSYASLNDLIEIVEPMNPSARLVWHMTWAYQSNSSHSDFSKYNNDQMTMYNAIVSAVQANIVTNDKIEIVIPAGTAIQNARTSYVGDTLTRDGYHLSYDYGRYIGSLTFVKALTGLSIDNITYAPTSVSANDKLVAIEAVNNAVAKPFEVTASTYATEPETPDEAPEGLVRVTYMDWISGAYWNSKDTSENHYYRIYDAGNSKYFWATRTFTKEQLPVGSVIEIASGYQYRPDGWQTAGVVNSGTRKDNVTTAKVVIDEAWWTGYNIRAFNISTTDGANMTSYTEDQINEIFKIYVPESAAKYNQEPVRESIVDENGLVKSENCVSEVVTINGVEYRALTADAMGLTALSYYWSEKITVDGFFLGDTETASKYFATKQFDKNELMNGTLIWVASGWQYRPDGWEYTGSRPANTEVEYTIVSDTWWSSYVLRGFNISTTTGDALTDKTVEEIYEVFKIYIPVELIAE